MSYTSQTDIGLYEPVDGAKVDFATLKYMAALSRHHAHDCLVDAFVRSGISQSELAHRVGYDKSRVSRLLNTPANLTVETLGEMLFAIDGSSPVYGCKNYLREAPRNQCEPEWLAIPQGTLTKHNVVMSSAPGAARQVKKFTVRAPK
ncbi:helix-turn-helix transcriptional regulator [Pelagibacterium sp. 26DY04]|uniref:helix-turn-helix domain-containing protein n=1 Tax=Pelagibacterium sp. 26DY04 TaxID=2967130 RepID=UPI0028160F4A|nr:helix-turn-helix transcriptional regulator [Pelagibacterium sp. 26DY04]WMT88248.1 helix-turn-helix transcriptional regulator [Pelagibacterium sp. 26DY04]